MAKYQVMSWQGIPSQIKVTDDSGEVVKRQMPAFFQLEIDRVAMAEGLIGSDAYLDAWVWSDVAERDGSAEEVADGLVDELGEEWQRANRSESD
jgi:hypothetical protein